MLGENPSPSQDVIPTVALMTVDDMASDIRRFRMAPEYENSPLVQENLSRLEASGEVGQYLVQTYLAAIALRPGLQDTKINPYSSSELNLPGTVGRATLPSDSESGYPEVSVNVTSWEDYSQLMQDRWSTVAEIARKLGIEPDAVDAKTFAAFTLGHELGHIEDWRTRGFDAKHINTKYNAELDTLPVPGVPAATIVAWAARAPQVAKDYVEMHRRRLERLGIHSVQELVAAQDQAYRALPSEDAADLFAVAVINSLKTNY